MSFKYGFYNSLDGDRVYDARDFTSIFDGIINDGVFATVGKAMLTRPGTGLQVIVGNGKAWFQHTYNTLDADLPLTIGTAHGVYTRVDAVVLEVDAENRTNSIEVITGTAASSPQRPTLEDYQHPLAYVTVPKNATSISAANIDIIVGTSACPFVTGILETVDIDELLSKWNQIFADDRTDQAAEFHAWFDHLIDELSEHQAANLQRQIDEARGEMAVMDTFKVGDFLNTKRTDLGGNWALCNGATYFASEIPEAADLFVVTKLSKKKSNRHPIEHNKFFTRMINHRPMMMGYEYYGSSKAGCVLAVGDIHVSAPPAINPSVPLPSQDPDGTDVAIVAYNETTQKYAVYLRRAGTSLESPFFYETSQDPATMAAVTANWTRCTSVPTSLSEKAITDFIWWNGYYFAVINDGIWRCPDLSQDQWTKVLALADAHFSIVDNKLFALKSIIATRSVTAAFIDNPFGTWSTITLSLPGSSMLSPPVDLSVVGGKYILSGRRNLNCFTFETLGSATVSLVPSISIAGQPHTPSCICENSDYYFALCKAASGYSAHTIIRSKKIAGQPIDFTDPSKWEFVLSLSEGQEHYAIYSEPGSNYAVVMYGEGGSSALKGAILYASDVVQIPSISLSSEFYTYVKIGETDDPTPVETLPLVYVDSFDPDTGTLNLVSNSEES